MRTEHTTAVPQFLGDGAWEAVVRGSLGCLGWPMDHLMPLAISRDGLPLSVAASGCYPWRHFLGPGRNIHRWLYNPVRICFTAEESTQRSVQRRWRSLASFA